MKKNMIVLILLVMPCAAVLYVMSIFSEEMSEKKYSSNVGKLYADAIDECNDLDKCDSDSLLNGFEKFKNLHSLKLNNTCDKFLLDLNDVSLSLIKYQEEADIEFSNADKINLYGYHIFNLSDCLDSKKPFNKNYAVGNMVVISHIRKSINNIYSPRNRHNLNKLDIFSSFTILGLQNDK